MTKTQKQMIKQAAKVMAGSRVTILVWHRQTGRSYLNQYIKAVGRSAIQ